MEGPTSGAIKTFPVITTAFAVIGATLQPYAFHIGASALAFVFGWMMLLAYLTRIGANRMEIRRELTTTALAAGIGVMIVATAVVELRFSVFMAAWLAAAWGSLGSVVVELFRRWSEGRLTRFLNAWDDSAPSSERQARQVNESARRMLQDIEDGADPKEIRRRMEEREARRRAGLTNGDDDE